jgi:hypothetical protein
MRGDVDTFSFTLRRRLRVKNNLIIFLGLAAIAAAPFIANLIPWAVS